MLGESESSARPTPAVLSTAVTLYDSHVLDADDDDDFSQILASC